MRHIVSYLKPHVPRIFRGICIKFIGTVMDLGIPYVLAHLIDDVIPTADKAAIFGWGGIMILFSVIGLTGNVLANRLSEAVARDTTIQVRHDLFEKILSLSAGQTDQVCVSSLVSRMTTDTYNVHKMIGMAQRLGIRGPILLTGGIVMTLLLDPVMAAVLIATIPFIAAATVWVYKKGIPLYHKLQQVNDKMVRVIRENISGIRVIKALSKTDYEKERFDGVNGQVCDSDAKASLTMSLTNPAINLFLNIGLSLVVLVGALRVMHGRAQVGEIVAFTSYFMIILNAMMGITRIFVMSSKAVASGRRIEEVLNLPEEMTKERMPLAKVEGYVVFDRVSFGYGHTHILKNISFSVEKGGSLGIIGATGSGKTTIVNLLMRFYDTKEGDIFVDSRNIRSFELKELRRKFGTVFQNDLLFADTVENNIRFDRDLDRSRLQQAAEDAQANFIGELEGQYDFHVAARGTNLSGGQKQRLLIARALADHPDILILDDSSSALDYKTDAMLRQAVRQRHGDSTLIMIAQRVSSVKDCDQILVLENGSAVGCGSHDRLMETCEIYREIAVSQMGEGVENGTKRTQ